MDAEPELSDADRERRLKLVEKAAGQWAGQLVDLTGRNNLLYYKDLRVGTLTLDQVPRGRVIELLAGRSLSLAQLFPDLERRADALKRARAVRNRATAHYEERGLETLYLACGMATWTGRKSAATPAAPVLLVPVSLVPVGAAQEEFTFSVTGELEVNPTFLHMLKVEFEIDCDPAKLLDSAKIEGTIDTAEELEVAFRHLEEQCSKIPGFEVGYRFVVGSFSYAKLPMVRDLETSLEALAEHDVIAALAGDKQAQESLRRIDGSGDIPSPDHVPPNDEFLVLDADSSQNYAINAVLAGRNLIIKGPPGTGKSQTIANLISTLTARGKRTLFVAEKRAAIDAVLRRLNDVGLGDLVLDLHGGVSSRRKTAQDLQAALTRNAEIVKPRVQETHRTLENRRQKLNQRVDAIHSDREPWGLSYYDVMVHLAELPQGSDTRVRFRGEVMKNLAGDTANSARENLRELVGLGGLALSTSDAPWARATILTQSDAMQWQGDVERLASDLPQIVDSLAKAAESVGEPTVKTRSGWMERLNLWGEVEAFLGKVTPEIFDLNLDELAIDAKPLGESGMTRLGASMTSSEYRLAKKRLREHFVGDSRANASALHSLLQEAISLRNRWAEIGAEGPRPAAPSDLESLRTRFDDAESRLEALGGQIKRAIPDTFADVETYIDELLRDAPKTLSKLPRIRQLRSDLERLDLGFLLVDLEERVPTVDPVAAVATFDRAWLQSLADQLPLDDPLIGAFDGEQYRRIVSEFQVADRDHVQTTAHRVRRIAAELAIAAEDKEPESAALVRHEAGKRRRHLPTKQLFSAAHDVVASLKPCWAMSPLLVSQLLPSDRTYFDVVIFDEASQVRPAEAMAAIVRAKQVIAAGDERQLPPTSFFDAEKPDAEDGEEGAEGIPALSVSEGYESILEALAPFIGSRMLQWHYRSRDERLIAFSNVNLYDRSLTTFPGVLGKECISHVLVPFEPGLPDTQGSSTAEVDEVVQLILDHAENRSNESLGVIAMGIKHANRIEDALRETLRDRPDLEDFFVETRHEPFFIKNLERVQGDERDAIVLSVGYGRNEDGRLRYHFGPLNQEGGQRRLNVAVTRAKSKMTLVSTFDHGDMDPDRSKSEGVRLLRAYLQYCGSNGAELGEAADSIPELNPFEIDVRDRLEGAGIPLSAQYGCSGYRIDFAAKHPKRPGEMVLAIECDGATYHSSASARDRDRLRQEQLERLGWTFHRIWSQDWFNDPNGQIELAQEAYAAAVNRVDQEDGGSRAARASDSSSITSNNRAALRPEPPPPSAGPPERGQMPTIYADGNIGQYSQPQLVSIINWIDSDGLLRTREQLVNELLETLGYRRRGKNIMEALNAAIDITRG